MKKNNTWKIPVCNLCHSKKQNVLFRNLTYWEYPGVFQIVQCPSCSLIFVSPRPPFSEIAQYYGQEQYFGRDMQSTQSSDNEIAKREKAYGNIYTIILQKKKKGKILDIGAGTGLFLSKFQELGWDVDGVELVKDAVSYAKKNYGVKLRQGDFFDFSFKKNSFDVITLNGALEHLYNPQETLKRIYPLLKKDGVILFSVPNVTSMGNKIFGRHWFPWQPPRHLYHFSPKTARLMLANAGFTNISIRHDYWEQNYYILFQSLRYSHSPKFAMKKTGGLVSQDSSHAFSLKKEIGKIVGKVFAFSLSVIEPLMHQGEILIVYAKK